MLRCSWKLGILANFWPKFNVPTKRGRRRIVSKTDEKFECPVCFKKFDKSRSLKTHQKSQHVPMIWLKCEICEQILKSVLTFESHKKIHAKNYVDFCKECQVGFFDRHRYKRHLAVKHDPDFRPSFQCELCGLSCVTIGGLNTHRRKRHSNEPKRKFACTGCDKVYAVKHRLTEHVARVHDKVDQSALCDFCGKRLSSKEHLRLHKRTHTGLKPHSCSFCSMCFISKERLKEHMCVHTGQRPFVCDTCGKGFTQRSSRRIHMRTHSGERPYKCRFCDRGFISKGVVDNHMKRCKRLKDS